MYRRSTFLPRALALCSLLTGIVATGSPYAAELYRWVEADGSITFSPTPPTDGSDYEEVDTSSAGPDATAPIAVPLPASSETDAALQDERTTRPLAAMSPSTRSQAPVDDVAGLNYAPPPLGAAIDASKGIAAGARASSAQAASPPVGADKTDNATANPSDVRRARCRELAKRVISLERRLTATLSAEEMDNTVLYMARYQANVDRHCRS